VRDLVEGVELAALVEAKQGTVLHCTFYNAKLPASQRHHSRSLNAELLRSGYASVSGKTAYARARSAAVGVLLAAQDEAKSAHVSSHQPVRERNIV
jgi:hypothetical protein